RSSGAVRTLVHPGPSVCGSHSLVSCPTPLPQNQVMKRSGFAAASASPFGPSIASRVGRPTATATPPAIPRSIIRRFRTNFFAIVFSDPPKSLRRADEQERRARDDLHQEVLDLVLPVGERLVERIDRGLLIGRLDVTHRVPEEVLHHTVRP